MNFLENDFLLLSLVFGTFAGARYLQKRSGIVLLNPILITVALVIGYLKLTDVSFETFHKSGLMIEFWLKPAIVALGVPLYKQLSSIKKQIIPIIVSQIAGCVVGVISVVFLAKWCGATKEVILSLSSKSVTTPIAIEVTKALGGIPPLTAAVVISMGIFGALFGFFVLRLFKVTSPIAQGLSMGTACHAVGTSAAMEISHKYGSFATLGLTINGLFTAIFTPILLHLIGIL